MEPIQASGLESILQKQADQNRKTQNTKLGGWFDLSKLPPEDELTLQTSQVLLDKIFAEVELPKAPYSEFLVLAPIVEALDRHRNLLQVEARFAGYEKAVEATMAQSEQEAKIRAQLWHRLLKERGAHLQPQFEKQLQKTIEKTFGKNPELSLQRAQLLESMFNKSHQA